MAAGQEGWEAAIPTKLRTLVLGGKVLRKIRMRKTTQVE